MAALTHHQARTLLQAAVDHPLAPADRSALEGHLAQCGPCKNYARQLSDLEETLRSSLHTRWDTYRPALDFQRIQNSTRSQPVWYRFFTQTTALGKVTAMVALLLGTLLIANLFGVRVPISNSETPTALPTPDELMPAYTLSPTPSTQAAMFTLASLSCETTTYIVQSDDTLESIAVRHGTTREAILEYNQEVRNLASNIVFTGMELAIPLCKRTPSFTASIPANTLTITPAPATILPGQPQ